MPERRTDLDFPDFDAIAADVNLLLDRGYDRAGKWSLAQACDHLDKFTRGSLDGFPGRFRLPWPLTAAFRKLSLSEKAMAKPMPSGLPSPSYLAPADAGEDAAAVDAYLKTNARFVERFESKGPLHRSPLFGKLPPDLWRRVHLKHAAHHLGFLVPKP